MGGTAWFWNGASPSTRRAVAIVFLAAAAVWLLIDLLRGPDWSASVPVFLIAFFGAQWYWAVRDAGRAVDSAD
jgi:hypothetical protein